MRDRRRQCSTNVGQAKGVGRRVSWSPASGGIRLIGRVLSLYGTAGRVKARSGGAAQCGFYVEDHLLKGELKMEMMQRVGGNRVRRAGGREG